MTPLERHCGWLLHAYPSWYRRQRRAEMLGTLLESSQPGRKWPSFRDTRALVIGGLRVRGWTWLLSMLWVLIGSSAPIYAIVSFSHPGYGQGDVFRPMFQWPTEPMIIIYAGIAAQLVWTLLPIPVMVAGFVRLRGWRPRNWLRVAGWAGSWGAGLVLMITAGEWADDGTYDYRGVLSAGEAAIFAAWLMLGAVITWILSAAPPRARSVPDKTVTGA